MENMVKLPQPLVNREQVIVRLIELAQAQLKLEGDDFAHKQVSESTPFCSLELPLIAWLDLCTDISEEWGLGEEDLPEEPDAELTAARLADLLLRLKRPSQPRPQSPLVQDQSPPPRKGHHNRKKKK